MPFNWPWTLRPGRTTGLRFAAGVVCGLVFGGTAGLKIATELGIAGTIGSFELMLMGIGRGQPLHMVGARPAGAGF